MNAASQGGSALAKYVASLIDQSLSWKVIHSSEGCPLIDLGHRLAPEEHHDEDRRQGRHDRRGRHRERASGRRRHLGLQSR